MIGGPIGLGLGVPLVTATTVVQSGALASPGLAAVSPVGKTTAAVTFAVSADAVTTLRGEAIAAVSFLLESDASVVGIGLTTSEATTTIAGLASLTVAGTSTAAVSFSLASDATVGGVGGATGNATHAISGTASSSLSGRSTANVTIAFAGTSALAGGGLTTTHATFEIIGAFGFAFENVPLLAGTSHIQGVTTPDFAGAFSTLPTRDAVPAVAAGAGCNAIQAGLANKSISGNADAARRTIRAGFAKRSASGGSATTNTGL